MDDRVKLKVMGITYSQIQNGAYALVLAEENGDRRIPIIIGTAEAQSIAIRLEHLTPPRPMTHDLFASFAQGFGIRLREVFVYHYEDGVFSSELLFDDGTRQIRIDSRTSDAIAIALRTQSPIYTTEKIISEAGIIFQEEPKEKNGNPGAVLALVLFALLGGGAAFYYFKFLKPKQNVKGDTDLEDFEFEDYDEDEPEADTGEVSKEEETEDEEV